MFLEHINIVQRISISEVDTEMGFAFIARRALCSYVTIVVNAEPMVQYTYGHAVPLLADGDHYKGISKSTFLFGKYA